MGLLAAALLAHGAPLAAQEPPPPPTFAEVNPSLGAPYVASSPLLADPRPRGEWDDPARFWIRGEFLLWWVKNAPLPASLVVTAEDKNNPVSLFDSDVNFRALSGVRFALGGWFDFNRNIGIESNFFVLRDRARDFYAASDSNGNPPLAYAFFNRTPGMNGEYLMPIASPGKSSGDVLASSSLSLWGTEIQGAFCLLRRDAFEFTVLAGFRYADLQEDLDLSTSTNDFANNTTTIVGDHFFTRNQFYGGQVGGRIRWQGDRLALDVTGKLALGVTHQVVDIQGESIQYGPGFASTGFMPGGFFTQSSNMGRFSANPFTFLPALELKVNYQLSPRWRVFAGYDFMYWSRVVRPGDQLDRNINLTQSPLYGAGVLVGPAAPVPLFTRSDFWAQGMTLGMEFRF